MCTLGGAAATTRGIGSIAHGHSENCEGQSRRFEGSLLAVRDKFGALACADTCVVDKR